MPSHTSLVPGYEHVENFEDDAEYEDLDGEVIEEVEYVTLDLGVIEPTLVPSTSAYRLIGLDTPTPFLQLSGTVFKGEHHELLGTELVFGEVTDPQSEQNKRTLAHIANTEKRIQFKEVELKPKIQAPEPTLDPHIISTPTTIPVKRRRPETLEQLVGNESMDSSAQHGRRGRKPKGKGRADGEDEAADVVSSAPQAMDTLDD